ncbi:MAG: YitT family protein [Bacteroidota bacterium]
MKNKEKPFSKKWITSYVYIIIGTFSVAAAYVLFLSPHKIIPGGIYGISIVLHYISKGVFAFAPDGLPIGLTALAFNIPLTLIAIKILGPRFGTKTIVSFILTSIFVDTLTHFWGERPLVKDDVLLSCVFGGLILGIGVGLIFKAKATSGGSDVISMILAKYTKMPIGQLVMIVDSIIVITGLVAFGDWKIPLYSWIVIFILGKTVDVVLEGISYDKTLFIISDKHDEIRTFIINDLNRGGTYIAGKGMYNGSEKSIIFTVVNRRELSLLEEFISRIDADAFMSVIDANEIIGKGFKSIDEKVGT